MFIGRQEELSYLEKIYNESRELRTCSILGRRGVGKSTIIEKFCENKRNISIQFVQESRVENMNILHTALSEFLDEELERTDSLVDYFKKIGDICSIPGTVLVLDEFPYLIETSPEAPSVLQWLIDTRIKHMDCMMIVCGSKTTVMRKETEDHSRPLYGRIDNRLLIKPLSLSECSEFHKGMNDRDLIRTYMTVGGIPRYHERLREKKYEDNIIRYYLQDIGSMSTEGPSFVRSQIDNSKLHLAVLSCISTGSVKQKDISERLHVNHNQVKIALDELEMANIVERQHPMMGAPKKPIYQISDNLVAFHYMVVNRVLPLFRGEPDKAYKAMEQRLDTYMGHMFELVCRDYVVSHFTVSEIGKWWGKIDSEDADIDIVAKIVDDDLFTRNLFCECKFTKKPIGFETLNALRYRVDRLKVDNPVLMLFSAGGFESDLREYAEENGVILIGLEDLLS